jgi:hypothetical protein
MRAVAVPGRWVWGLSGLATAAVLVIPGARLFTTANGPWHRQPAPDTITRTLTVNQTVTSLDVQSNGGSVQVTTGAVRHVQVTEALSYDSQNGGPPAVVHSVSGGRLTLADPGCATSNCTVSFAVIVPSGVAVTAATDGGPVAVAGAAGANVDSGGGPMSLAHISGALTASTEGGSLQMDGTAEANVDSGGGPVTAAKINGPLTISTDGGSLQVDGLTGTLRADTGGGPLLMQNVNAATATASTGGGSARIDFSAAPDTVTLSTDGGPAMLTIPGGPYAVTAESDGGPQLVGLATDSTARRSITVTSGGGSLQIDRSAGHSSTNPSSQP